MGKEEIDSKLGNALKKNDLNEHDVVYILSRIRKILDIDKNKKYKKLKFFCNWALHIQIDDTAAVNEELKNFPEDMISSHEFLMYKPFHEDFKGFLEEYNFTTNIYENNDKILTFNKLLTDIYTDTPLVVKSIKKKIITIKSLEYTKENIGGTTVRIPATTFTVTYEE